MDLKTNVGGIILLGVVAFVGAVWLSGCASNDTTIERPPRRIQLPQSGELELHAQALAPVGNVLPVRLSVKSVAPRARTFKQSGVCGITDSGERIQELSLDDPTVVANGAGLLQEVGGGESAFSETFGEATCERRGMRQGCAMPWGLMVAGGPFEWIGVGVASAVTAARSPSSRLADYELHSGGFGSMNQGTEITGYAFLPNRHYAAIEFSVLNALTNNDELITVPLASETPATVVNSDHPERVEPTQGGLP